MTQLLNANTLNDCITELVTHAIQYSDKERKPKAVIIVASDDKASKIYVNNKVKTGEKLGIDIEVVRFNESVTESEIIEFIHKINNDDTVDGAMLQLPVYKHLNGQYLINQLCPYKDIDGLTWYNRAMLDSNKAKLVPCTPLGVINLLQVEGIKIVGKNVVIVGKGDTAGAPMATTFRNYDATVTICHKETPKEELEFFIRHADIVVSCVGKQNLLEPEWFKEGSIVIGVGLSYDENGKQQLDFDVDKVVELGKASLVSQRTNCTGKATVLALMCNIIIAYNQDEIK